MRFSAFVVLQTWLSPAQGCLVQWFGPRRRLSVGAVPVDLSWLPAARASGLWSLCPTYGVPAGIGAGIVFAGAIGLMVAWLPDRRSRAAGLAAAGYGAGAILTAFPVAWKVKVAGYAAALVTFGAIPGAVALLAAQGLRRLPVPLLAGHGQGGEEGVACGRMFRSGRFWPLLAMMAGASTCGCMVISQVSPRGCRGLRRGRLRSRFPALPTA